MVLMFRIIRVHFDFLSNKNKVLEQSCLNIHLKGAFQGVFRVST